MIFKNSLESTLQLLTRDKLLKDNVKEMIVDACCYLVVLFEYNFYN